MSERDTESDIEPSRVNVAEAPEAEMTALSSTQD
jgi:hypothetical protein